MFAKDALSLDGSISNLSSGLALPNDRTIKISVITGPSTGLTHRLTKAKTSIGQVGGGADIEINDPQVSRLHCVTWLVVTIVPKHFIDSTSF